MSTLLREIRQALDARAIDIAALGRSRELSLALTTCQQGRMLLGVTLRLLGSATPYPQSDNPKSDVVAPAADTCGDYQVELPKSPIAAVKSVRERLGVAITALEAAHPLLFKREVGSDGNPVFSRSHAEATYERAYTELTLAKNWLGMELSRIAYEQAKVPAPKA